MFVLGLEKKVNFSVPTSNRLKVGRVPTFYRVFYTLALHTIYSKIFLPEQFGMSQYSTTSVRSSGIL